MEKIALITDTAADLDDGTINKYNIKVLSFRIIYKDREYLDKVDITPKEVYDNFSKEVPTSSLPSMGDMDNLFTKLEEEGYTHAIVIPLSTGLSGILGGIKVASEAHTKIKTLLFDSKSISLGEGIQVKHCAELIANGKSFDEICKLLPEFQKRIHLFFIVGTLEYLIRGGRIGKVSGTIGELLNIKPIISLDNDGIYYTYTKVRGRKQSLNKLIELAKEITQKQKCEAFVMDGGAEEECQKVYDMISKLSNITNLKLGGNISPVSCVHSGPGLIGLVLVEDFSN